MPVSEKWEKHSKQRDHGYIWGKPYLFMWQTACHRIKHTSGSSNLIHKMELTYRTPYICCINTETDMIEELNTNAETSSLHFQTSQFSSLLRSNHHHWFTINQKKKICWTSVFCFSCTQNRYWNINVSASNSLGGVGLGILGSTHEEMRKQGRNERKPLSQG